MAPPAAEAPIASTSPDAAALRAVASRAGLTGEPTRVHFDQPRTDGPLWALGRAWKASFDESGFTVIPYFGTNAPRNFPLRLELARATAGGELLPLTAGKPVATDATVRTPRGALTEVVDARLDSLEQSFVFDTLPNRGAIAVEVGMSGEFQPAPIADGLRFANQFGHVDYTKAVAVDAKGQRLPLEITWTGTSARMEIPASFVEQAQLPIVLDPVITYWYLLGVQGVLLHDSDVATIQAPGLGGRTLLIWQRNFSASDTDCYGLMFDANLGLIQTDFIVDFTSEDWLKVAVAGSNYAQNFLVVAESRTGLLHYISGRLVAANAIVGAQFNIERDGVVGLTGHNFHPDVGSDPYFGVGRYTVVFNKRIGAQSDIYYKQVDTNGGLVTTNPTALDTSTHDKRNPSISKSCGQSSGPLAQWLVTWQRTWATAPFDQEVHGGFIRWNGTLMATAFPIAYSAAEESAPSPCSPIDFNGQRYWPVAYEHTGTLGQPRDVIGCLVTSTGTVQDNFLASSGVPGSDDRAPSVDSDGTRFVVCMTTGTTGNPQHVESVTLAYLGPSSFRVEERSDLATNPFDNFGQCSICASYSGGSTMTPRYFISFTEHATNTFRLEVFAGHTGNTTYFTTRPSQCGSLSITASGSPVIGQTVTVSVGGTGFSGTLLGFPNVVPILGAGCNCWLGVDSAVTLGNPLVWTVPNNVAFVSLPLAVQGFSFSGTQCLGVIDLSDTVDFTIR